VFIGGIARHKLGQCAKPKIKSMSTNPLFYHLRDRDRGEVTGCNPESVSTWLVAPVLTRIRLLRRIFPSIPVAI
jgi:hypothetical protein